MNILVTGADGFIGSRLTEMLLERGHSVTALVLYNQFNSRGWLDDLKEDVVSRLTVVQGDVRDTQTLQLAMKDVDAVIHLAALIAIPYSYQAVRSYVDVNVVGTTNLLEVAREKGVKKFVQASTSEVYGTAQYVPIDENHPLVGQSPYSASKIGADQLALSYFAAYGLPVSIIRPFNTYGPRQSSRAIIPTVISQLNSESRSLKLGSLHPTRDFTFVDDTVRGFIYSVESTNDIGQVCNLGSNFEISIRDTVSMIADIMCVTDYRIESDDIRVRPKNSEVERLWSDNSKAAEILGWSPDLHGIVGFQEGVSKTVDWYLSHRDRLGFRSDPMRYVV